jgi:division protein CdvB (Snf7/Vps24/ESCRT-III family)
MKITITVELDQEATQMIANPLASISQKITKLIESFEQQSQVIEPTPEDIDVPSSEIDESIEEEHIQEAAQPKKAIQEEPIQESVNNIPIKKNIRETILETIKSKRSGMKSKEIQEITGLTGSQISNNVVYLKKAKLVRKTPKGFFVYIPPKEPSSNSGLDSK